MPGASGLGPAGGAGPGAARELAWWPLGAPPLPAALAGEDCLWYLDRNGSWHPGFNCEFFTFCCGTCYQRYCCRDLTLLITERQQKHCLAFRWAPAGRQHALQPPSQRPAGPLHCPSPSPLPTSTFLAKTQDSSLAVRLGGRAGAAGSQESHMGNRRSLGPGQVGWRESAALRPALPAALGKQLWQEGRSLGFGSSVPFHYLCGLEEHRHLPLQVIDSSKQNDGVAKISRLQTSF